MSPNETLTEVQPRPLEDRSYGKHEGRVRDLFSHMWHLGSQTEALTGEAPRKQRVPSKHDKEGQS